MKACRMVNPGRGKDFLVYRFAGVLTALLLLVLSVQEITAAEAPTPEDLFPLTRAYVQGLPFAAVQARIAGLGVPADLAEAFWVVAKGNITVLADLDGWWHLIRDGAVPLVDDADRDFVAQAFAMLPPQPWSGETWGQWTAAVKAATGRKGKDLFRPLRRALTGRDAGPEMADLMPLLRRVPTV